MLSFTIRIQKKSSSEYCDFFSPFWFWLFNSPHSRFSSSKNKRLQIVQANYRQARKGMKNKRLRTSKQDVFVRKSFCPLPTFHIKISLRMCTFSSLKFPFRIPHCRGRVLRPNVNRSIMQDHRLRTRAARLSRCVPNDGSRI